MATHAPVQQNVTNLPLRIQQPVQYIDQHGNPIQVIQQPPAQQQPQVQYIQVVQQPQQPQPVQYVDQNGNPIQVVQPIQQQPLVMQPQIIETQQQSTVSNTKFGHFSVTTQCPKCNRTAQTKVNHEIGPITWKAFGWCCMLGICTAGFAYFFCLCCIPFCTNDQKEAHHHCSLCGHLIHAEKEFEGQHIGDYSAAYGDGKSGDNSGGWASFGGYGGDWGGDAGDGGDGGD